MNNKKSFINLFLVVLLSLSCLLTTSCGDPGGNTPGSRGTAGNSTAGEPGSGSMADESGNNSMAGESGNNSTAGESGSGAGTGQQADGESSPACSSGGQDIIYIPSFQSMTGAENGSCRNLEASCGFLYYSVMESGADGQNRRRFYRQSLKREGNWNPAEELYTNAEAWEELTADTYTFFTDARGYGYFILRKTGTDTGREQYFLCKYGVSGSELFRQDITSEMTAQTEDMNLFQRAVTDGGSHIYIGQTESIYLYDKEGNLHTKVPVPGDLKGMDCGRDGTVYVTWHTGRELVLGRVDYEKGTIEEICGGFPGDGSLYGGTEYDILTMDQQTMYGFSAGMETPETVLTWMDSNLYGNEISYIHGMEDGKLLAVTDSSAAESQLVFLAPSSADGRPAKELITIGVLSDQSCQALNLLAARFNRSSDNYRVELIIYGQGSKDTDALFNAINKANLAIISGDSPDLICLNRSVFFDTYVEKGILEDLTGYLESSSVLHREDILAPALEQFTHDDKLYGLTRAVTLITLAGRTDQVGEETGWSLEEMEQFIRNHSDTRPFSSCTKTQMLQTMLECTMHDYIDWKEGTCSFDSQKFRELLEFANSFPLEQFPDEELTLENGGVLLAGSSIMSVQSYTQLREAFGNEEITCIGFPTRHGSGTILEVSECTMGISAFSEHKEGAWELIEFMMTDDGIPGWNLPVQKDLLEKNFLDALGLDYVYDDKGNIMYDESGKPLTRELYTARYGCVPIQEDVDAVRQLLEAAEPGNLSWGSIFSIINEEAEPYFHGHKTLDQVVDIIQRRAQLCVSENQ